MISKGSLSPSPQESRNHPRWGLLGLGSLSNAYQGLFEVDHSTLNVIVIDELDGAVLRRPKIFLLYDRATGRVLGSYLACEDLEAGNGHQVGRRRR